MDPKPDHGETSYKGGGRLEGRKALVTGADSGIGRAAAIAFAREGADVAIVHLPSEETDAREVIALIRPEGREGSRHPGRHQGPGLLQGAGRERRSSASAASTSWSTTPASRSPSPRSSEITDEQFDATLKTNLYAMFWITQGRQEAPAARRGHHQHRLGPGLRSRPRRCSTTPPPRPASSPSPRRCPSS